MRRQAKADTKRTLHHHQPRLQHSHIPGHTTHFFIRADLAAELAVLGDVVVGGRELAAAAGALEARAVHQPALDQHPLGEEHGQLANRARLALTDGCGDVLRPGDEAVIPEPAARWQEGKTAQRWRSAGVDIE